MGASSCGDTNMLQNRSEAAVIPRLPLEGKLPPQRLIRWNAAEKQHLTTHVPTVQSNARPHQPNSEFIIHNSELFPTKEEIKCVLAAAS